MRSCRECGDRGSVWIQYDTPCPDSVCPPKFDDLPPQPAHEVVPAAREDLCTCVLAPGFADWVEI